MSAERLREAADKVEHDIEFGNVTDPAFWTALAAWLRASAPFSARGHIRPEALAVADVVLGGAT